MKLVNSLTEHNIHKALVNGREALYSSELGATIIKFLEKNSRIGKVNDVYVLDHFPDQNDEIFVILANSQMVIELEIEMPHDEEKTTENHIKIVNQEEVKEYEKSLKGLDSKLSLMIAMKLSNEK